MAKFKVGDKVRILDGSRISDYYGGWTDEMAKHVGEVHEVENIEDGVFGKVKIYLCGLGECGYGYIWDERCLVRADERKIVITSDGKTTTAALYNGKERVKTAKAKCSPEDTFLLETGAKLALVRLFSKKADKPQGIDWDAFKRGELSIEVTRDKFEGLMKALEKRGYVMLADGSKPTSVKNPWKVFEIIEKRQDIGGIAMRMLAKELHVEPKEHMYIEVAHDNAIGYAWECQDGKLVQEWR